MIWEPPPLRDRLHRPARSPHRSQGGWIMAPYRYAASDPGGPDPYFANVVLLVDASSESDGSTPGTIDVTGKTPTWRNNAQCKTNQFKFGASSIYLDGTNDRVSFADSSDWAMGTGDATWEAWIRLDGASSISRVYLGQATSTFGFYSIVGYRNSSRSHYGAVSSGSNSYGGTGGEIVPDLWTHVAIVRSGSNLYTYLNGTRTVVSTSVSGVSIMDSTGAMTIGGWADVDHETNWKGWIDQVRITKGVARYTASTITVPTAPFPHS